MSENITDFFFSQHIRYNIKDKDTFFDNATRSRIVSKQK